ncbi:hypothetical protein BD779DRAFT_1444977 [Infundibulicybe gibba]|nr:hypothetical protein BD779DRAFT_1444977 [Infundibulicybe gibba]
MLTLNPGSTCDVCAEEYGPHCLPHSIPCGHVLCATCCTTIAEKSAPRCAPVCPFCREPFSPADARVVRTDFASSGWTTPRRIPAMDAAADLAGALLAKKAERLLSAPGPKTRAEARKLEHKVARVAAKKCSVEEVTVLYKELQEWLTADTQQDEQSASLHLSAALLRAILINHIAHSEASKAAKMVEANLKDRIDDLEKTNKKLDAELHQ